MQEDVSATLSTRQDQTLFQSASKGEVETRDRECSGFRYHGSADARSIGHADEQSPTITSQGKPPAVCLSSDTAKAPCDVELSDTLEVGGSVPIVAHEKTRESPQHVN